ncbi:MAG TPA: hypothetical protein VHS31_17015 [Tepidisphaeraceae bacterium]|jgi:uncharacterized membrane protein|nr:hypothetical protein [Tepidisphaeraceae bacterium]
MNSFDQIARLLLAIAAIAAAGCFILAWMDIALHRDQKPLSNPQEMRRFMFCGFYCNPEDPRAVVHRPMGRGYTINLRHEQFVSILVVMLGLAMFLALLLCVVPGQ